LKILLIHCQYQLKGGEDTVVKQELDLLGQHHTVELLYFQNQSGIKGLGQFLSSIWNLSAARMVVDKINDFKPNIVHVHNWHFGLGPLVFRTVSQLGIPIVHTVHNYRLLCPSAILFHQGKLFTNSLQESFPWKAVRNKVYRSSFILTFWLAFIVWFHKKKGTWKKIDAYICLTPFAVELFQQSNFGVSKDLFTVKPNFTAISMDLQTLEREQHFLFIGRLSEEKGLTILLNAFKDCPFLLKIAGDGPLKELVLNAAKQFSNIIYLGSLTNEKVTEELQKTQGLIFPSVWYEGMPMTILEAFSTATPVIASNLGAMTSLISNGSNGFHFEPRNVNNLKESVAKFNALSIDQKKEMGAHALLKYQDSYSPELQMRYFEAIYNNALKKK
jgi:glycosyltransferase involved in cell wall biosynthesis